MYNICVCMLYMRARTCVRVCARARARVYMRTRAHKGERARVRVRVCARVRMCTESEEWCVPGWLRQRQPPRLHRARLDLDQIVPKRVKKIRPCSKRTVRDAPISCTPSSCRTFDTSANGCGPCRRGLYYIILLYNVHDMHNMSLLLSYDYHFSH